MPQRRTDSRATSRGRRRGAALLAALALALAGLAAAAVPAAASASLQQVVSGLRQQPVFVDPSLSNPALTKAQVSDLVDRIRGADRQVYVALLPAGSPRAAFADAAAIGRAMRCTCTVAVLGAGRYLQAGSNAIAGDADELASEAAADHRGDVAGGLAEFVTLVDKAPAAAQNAEPGTGGDQGGGSGSGGATGVVTAIVIVAILAVLGGIVFFGRRRNRRLQAAQFEPVREAAAEDVTVLGEDIARLDLDRNRLDEATSADYAAALTAYDDARRALDRAGRPEELGRVTAALEEGRYRMEAVRSRLAGKPVPDRRPPCFFNPRHGPSVADIEWSPAGGAARYVPVCAADADRIESGYEPDSRMLAVGGRRLPYWEASPIYAPYVGGYFGGYGGLMPGLLGGFLLGEALAGPGWGWGAGGYDMGYTQGYDQGYDQGFDQGDDYRGGDFGDFGQGGDFGGGDFGGGDFGGGDFGGGDFGGGDFGGGN